MKQEYIASPFHRILLTVEVFTWLTTLVLALLWAIRPSGPYEPFTFLVGFVNSSAASLRRWTRERNDVQNVPENKGVVTSIGYGVVVICLCFIAVSPYLFQPTHNETSPSTVSQLLSEYGQFKTYEGSFDSTIEFPRGIRIRISSEVKYARPDKFFARPAITLWHNTNLLTPTITYKIVANGGTAYILNEKTLEWMSVKAPSLSFSEREAGVEPLHQAINATLKPYQFLVSESATKILQVTSHIASSPVDNGDGYHIEWTETTHGFSKWPPSSPHDLPDVTIVTPIGVTTDSIGRILSSTANLDDYFKVIKSRNVILGQIDAKVGILTHVNTKTKYVTTAVDSTIPAMWFQFSPESNEREVPKLAPPLTGREVFEILLKALPSTN